MERLQLLTEAISSGQDIYDYIIIGAGISGLQAAEIITSKPNAKLLILEAQGYLGGRIGSISIGGLDNAKKTEWVQKNIDKINAAIVEKGATWVEERHLVVRELCKQFGITLREQHSEGTSTFLAKDRPYTQIELMNHPEYAPTIKLIIELIDSISEQYNEVVYSDLNLPSHEAKQMLKKYDRMTLEQFLIDRIPERQQIVRDIFDGFFEHTECLRCSENSMHEVLTKNARSNDLGILKEFLGDFGHEQCYLLNGGTALLISKFIELIERNSKRPINSMLKLKHQVITVDNRSPNFTTVVCETEGQMRRFRGKHIICAVPLAVSRLITFERLSPAKKLIIDNQLRTNSNKSFMITKKPFWRRDSQGKPMANGDSLLSKEYLANMSHDISPTDESCGIIVFFHNGRRLDAWDTTFGQEDYEKKRQYFIDLMSKMFGVSPKDQKKHFEDCFYYECSYMSDQFIRSGFQSLTRPGTFNEVLEIGDSLNALYRDENGITFIGSEYSLQFASYMQGAVRITREKVYKLIGEKDPLAHLLVDNLQKH